MPKYTQTHPPDAIVPYFHRKSAADPGVIYYNLLTATVDFSPDTFPLENSKIAAEAAASSQRRGAPLRVHLMIFKMHFFVCVVVAFFCVGAELLLCSCFSFSGKFAAAPTPDRHLITIFTFSDARFFTDTRAAAQFASVPVYGWPM